MCQKFDSDIAKLSFVKKCQPSCGEDLCTCIWHVKRFSRPSGEVSSCLLAPRGGERQTSSSLYVFLLKV
jgi:hypothetical protein